MNSKNVALQSIEELRYQNAPRNVDELTFTSRDKDGLICWWDVTPPKTNYWEVYHLLGKAYAIELLDLIENPSKTEKLSNFTFGCIASEIARQGQMLNDGLYMGFFKTISEKLIRGKVDR